MHHNASLLAKGRPKRGAALLAGLLRCGHCGRKLFVAYSGSRGRVTRYACQGAREHRGSAACQSFGGVRVERAVIDTVLETVKPAGVQAALDAMEEFDQQQDEKDKAKELALEKARYEADRARRQYDAVDPANRLVAGELEARWNVALEQVIALEQQCEQAQSQRKTLSETERTQLLDLGGNLAELWNNSKADVKLKKRILRTVVEEIVVRDDDHRRKHLLVIHWKGGIHSELQVPRNTKGMKAADLDKTPLELIEELSKVCSDQAIAATLNRIGYRTGAGKTWRLHSVHTARSYHRLKNHRNSDKWLTIDQTSEELNVSETVIRRLIREGTLPATQVVAMTPWIIARPSLTKPAVKAAIAAVHAGRRPHREDPQQEKLPLK